MSAKIESFNSQINRYQQNWMFVKNQGQIFQQLNNEDKTYKH